MSTVSSRPSSPPITTRPRAKVNSSALRRTPSVTRPSSPARQSAARVKTTKSLSSELRPSKFTTSSDALGPGPPRRQQSPALKPSRSELPTLVADEAVSRSLRIRSRVTAMAKNNPEPPSASSPATSTTTGTARLHARRFRAGSVSLPPASSPASSTTLAYPITTAAPAANPHRYTTPRSSRSGFSFSASSSPKPGGGTDDFRPFSRTSVFPSSHGSSYGSLGRATLSSVDPTNIPPLPQSPPASALSLSSRSSNFTHDSGTSPESSVVSGGVQRKKEGSHTSPDLGTTLDNLIAYASSREDSDSPVNGSFGPGSTVEEDEERAEAKSNRKMADLEITNRSLLAINSSLEKTKVRQTKEIRELRRKLRETRLMLPPITYRAVQSSLDPSEIGDDEEDVDSDDGSSSGENDALHSVDRGTSTGHEKDTNSATYHRIKLIIENLLETGQKALEKTKQDVMDSRGGAKVLTAEEVESWRDSGAASSTVGRLSDSESHLDDEDASYPYSGHLTPSHSPTPLLTLSSESVIRPSSRQSNFGLSSSSTVKLLSSPKLPPILITEIP